MHSESHSNMVIIPVLQTRMSKHLLAGRNPTSSVGYCPYFLPHLKKGKKCRRFHRSHQEFLTLKFNYFVCAAAVNKSLWIEVRQIPSPEPGFQRWIQIKWSEVRKTHAQIQAQMGVWQQHTLCRSMSKHCTLCGSSASVYSEICRWHHEGCHYDLSCQRELICFKNHLLQIFLLHRTMRSKL